MTTSKQRNAIIKAAADLPPAHARRVLAHVSKMPSGDMEKEMQSLRAALAEDLRPIAEAMWSAYQEGDLPAVQAALTKLLSSKHDLPVGNHLATALAKESEHAWLGY
jgi:hypothetical protein